MDTTTQYKTPGITTFCPCGSDGKTLLRVNTDIHTTDALAHSANLLRVSNQLLTDSAMGDCGTHLAWAALYLNETALAIVEDLSSARLICEQ